jgi:hypothetical protein
VRRLEGVVGALTHAWQAELDVSMLGARRLHPAGSNSGLINLGLLLTSACLPDMTCPLQDVESQIPVLLGDSTLAAAAVVYLGALHPAQRAAALQAWHALLQVGDATSCASARKGLKLISTHFNADATHHSTPEAFYMSLPPV